VSQNNPPQATPSRRNSFHPVRVWPPRRRLPEAETGGGLLLENELADDHQQRRGRRQRTDGESNVA